MKKIALLTAVLLAFCSLTACGGGNENKDETKSTTIEEVSDAGYNEYGMLKVEPETCIITQGMEGVTLKVISSYFFRTNGKYFVIIQPQYTNDTQVTYNAPIESLKIKDNLTGEEKTFTRQVDSDLGSAVSRVDNYFRMDGEVYISNGETSVRNWIGGYVSKDCRDATITIPIFENDVEKGAITVQVKAPQ